MWQNLRGNVTFVAWVVSFLITLHVGILMQVAGASKVKSQTVRRRSAGPDEVRLARWGGVGEVALGTWLISGWWSQIALASASVLLLAFAAYHAVARREAVSQCACIPHLNLSIDRRAQGLANMLNATACLAAVVIVHSLGGAGVPVKVVLTALACLNAVMLLRGFRHARSAPQAG